VECLISDRLGLTKRQASHQLVFLSGDVGDIHIVGGGAKFFKLLAGKDVDGDKMDFCVTVLASLRGRHIDNLAGAVFDHNEAVLSQGRALHREGRRGAGIGGFESVLMLLGSSVSFSPDVNNTKNDDILKPSNMRPSDGGACAGWCLWDSYLRVVRHLE
jgi:hypothetical protein